MADAFFSRANCRGHARLLLFGLFLRGLLFFGLLRRLLSCSHPRPARCFCLRLLAGCLHCCCLRGFPGRHLSSSLFLLLVRKIDRRSVLLGVVCWRRRGVAQVDGGHDQSTETLKRVFVATPAAHSQLPPTPIKDIAAFSQINTVAARGSAFHRSTVTITFL